MKKYFSILLSFILINSSLIAQDFSPPIISSFTFSPDTVDITSTSKNVTIKVLASD